MRIAHLAFFRHWPRRAVRATALAGWLAIWATALDAAHGADPKAGDAATSSTRPAPAFVVWTTMRPTDGMARALSEAVTRYNAATATAPLAVRFIALGETFDEWGSGPEPDLPPDAYFVADTELRALAQAGRIAPLDADGARTLAADAAHIEPVALERASAEGRLLGLPLCADMTVEYVNTSLPKAGEVTDADWSVFQAGKCARWRGTSDHARPLVESVIAGAKASAPAASPAPTFGFKVLTAPGGEELGRKSLRVWVLARAAGGTKPAARALDVANALQQTKTSFISGAMDSGGKLPVHRFPNVPAYVHQMHFEGPWLDAWAAKPASPAQ